MSRGRRTLGDDAVDIAVVSTLDIEAEPFTDRLKHARQIVGNQFTIATGLIGGRRVAVMQCNAGKRLAVALDALASVHRPRCIVAAGFAVGLGDQLSVGDVLFASEVVAATDPETVTAVAADGVADRSSGIIVGRFVSTRTIPKSATEKKELARRTGAIAADQTTATLALACRERTIRFLAARVLVEDASADARAGLRIALHPSRSFRVGGLVGAFLSAPGRASNIVRLREKGRKLAERLAKFLVPMFGSTI
jgi:nucleoside phosphorylase